jgi:hypothetical protein
MSPTLLREDGFHVKMYFPPREHGPAHVHVEKAGDEAVIMLADCSVREVYGLRAADVAAAVAIVEAWQDFLTDTWEAIHGAA